jgi:Raf kinase inhibitor-like YbhB/YbcL family protein
MKKTSRRIRLIWTAVLGVALICISVVAAKTSLLPDEKENIVMPMIIMSPSFKHDGVIPARHTCDGLNISPLLRWTGVPTGTKSLALIVDDPDAPNPDAPKMTWVHWVVYNISPDTNGLPETAAAEGLPPGTLQGPERLARYRLPRAVPPNRQASLFFQTLRAEYRFAGYETPRQGGSGEGDARPRTCPIRTDRVVPTAMIAPLELLFLRA